MFTRFGRFPYLSVFCLANNSACCKPTSVCTFNGQNNLRQGLSFGLKPGTKINRVEALWKKYSHTSCRPFIGFDGRAEDEVELQTIKCCLCDALLLCTCCPSTFDSITAIQHTRYRQARCIATSINQVAFSDEGTVTCT